MLNVLLMLLALVFDFGKAIYIEKEKLLACFVNEELTIAEVFCKILFR